MDIKLFLDSTYVLPTDYEEMEVKLIEVDNSVVNGLSQLRAKVLLKKSQIEIDKRVDESVKKNVEEGTKKLNEEVRTSSRQFLSLLSMFATIVVFVLGSVKTVPDLHCVRDKVLFLVGFAQALILFVVGIDFLIVKRPEEREIGILVVLISSLVATIVIFSLLLESCV